MQRRSRATIRFHVFLRRGIPILHHHPQRSAARMLAYGIDVEAVAEPLALEDRAASASILRWTSLPLQLP
jgi:hypothetical protein